MSTTLSRMDSIAGGDLFVFRTNDNADYRGCSQATFLSWLDTNFAASDPVTQLNTPGDGFNIQVNDNGTSTWLLLVPTGAISTGTIVLPAVANCVDGQTVTVSTTITVTTLTISLNGATAKFGDPSTVTAIAPFTLKFNKQTLSWYKI